MIRPATACDAQACAVIYAPYVREAAISFEDVPPTATEMESRIANALEWLVADNDGEILGYAYATRHRERAAYQWSCDVSVYLRQGARGRGLGTSLYERLLADLTERGFKMACAGITLPNSASEALHRRVGFTDVGVYREIGWKFGRWHDVRWLQLPLGDRTEPPTGSGQNA